MTEEEKPKDTLDASQGKEPSDLLESKPDPIIPRKFIQDSLIQ